MTERIPDIILRLAQQQLAADQNAVPELLAPGPPPMAIDDVAHANANPDVAHVHTIPNVAVGNKIDEFKEPHQEDSDPKNMPDEVATASPITESSVPTGPPLFTGGYVMRAADGGFEDEGLHNEATTAGGFAFGSEQTSSPDLPGPPLPRGGEHESLSGRPSAHPLVATIEEQGCRLEEVLGDLERSLLSLFGAQLETLNHLRDRAEEHERRWTEQTANRRAAFSPP